YADLGFDGSIWYGAGNFVDTAAWHLEMKKGQYSTRRGGALTGYIPKKLAHFQNTWTNSSSRSRTPYPWPIMRLADLYLLYAESLNEANNPGEATTWVNLVRE